MKKEYKKRSAGILMHITSLPSPFGVGDLGPEAMAFAEFLNRSNQSYWQILPLTPIQEEQGFSPYSSISSMAGNTLLISPEVLLQDKLLTREDVIPFWLPVTDHVNYAEAINVKQKPFDIAFHNSKNTSDSSFELFCNREAYWLDDYALFVSLKNRFKNTPWYEWPDPYKNRQLSALLEFTAAHTEAITKTKWLQYIFNEQWRELKAHCNKLKIKILGDLPFYMNYDSVDVWSRREIFDLKKDGRMNHIAGVPPDYFNEDGQLWGMPVYRWDILKDQRYDWWIKRIRKNLESVDELRLDHFRAFSEYWEVPAGKKTAVKGKWKPGPGEDFFNVLHTEFGRLPFVAEDLGDITEDVYFLRDRFEFPGMKVLQFAFGNTFDSSPHTPHNFTTNFIVYTGTHDNNTTRGWFENEISGEIKNQLSDYAGYPIDEKNVSKALIRMAYASVANSAIVPIQDVLGLDTGARMNKPATTANNWTWRLIRDELENREEEWLRSCALIYGRATHSYEDSK